MYLFLLSHSSTCHRMHWIIYADEIHALPFDLAKAGSTEIMGDLFNETFQELTQGWTHTGVWWLTLMWVDLSCWLLVFWDESAFKEMHIFNSGNRRSVRRCVPITPAFPLIVSKHHHQINVSTFIFCASTALQCKCPNVAPQKDPQVN